MTLQEGGKEGKNDRKKSKEGKERQANQKSNTESEFIEWLINECSLSQRRRKITTEKKAETQTCLTLGQRQAM